MRIIAGPCQHETLAQSSEIAKECKRVCDKHGIEYYFKASYDKANRRLLVAKEVLDLLLQWKTLFIIKDEYECKDTYRCTQSK